MTDFDRRIREQLPYEDPFLLVDEITEVDREHIRGCYTLKKDEYFYRGHFPGNPVTPGVILTEIAAQIGLVAFGLYLHMTEKEHAPEQQLLPFFSSAEVDFLKPVYPGEKVTVSSKKTYFRFNKLKCTVRMENSKGEGVLQGVLSGMIIPASG